MLRRLSGVLLVCALCAQGYRTGVGAPGDSDAAALMKAESFDRDPGWEGINNRMHAESSPTVNQDFGWSATHFAGKEAGEIGGTVWRSTTRAYYADAIAPKTLKDKLSASGSFAFTSSNGSSSLLFGWFNAEQPAGGRAQGALAMDFAGERHGLRLAVRLITGSNQTCGQHVTPIERVPGEKKSKPPSVRNDGTRYAWTMAYDPDAAGGKGQITFTIRGDREPHEEFEGKTISIPLPDGYKEDATTFDRFGILNGGKPGTGLTVWFDDLQYDGRAEDFSKEPAGWIGSGNRATYQPEDVQGMHNFGFSPDTHFAGGEPGEIGGAIWGSQQGLAWYADRVGPLSLGGRLEASGKVLLAVGAPDSGAAIGWFNGNRKNAAEPAKAGNFVGVSIGGPTRVGHYFRPALSTSQATDRLLEKAPVLVPGKVYSWTFLYDPSAGGGNGAVTVTLGGESATLNLKPGDKAQGATLDRFGLFSFRHGGNMLKIYFDDLKYTAGAPARAESLEMAAGKRYVIRR